jgi:iron complex outermembrane receptor protein
MQFFLFYNSGTTGLVRWKGNLFQNRVRDFIYGQISGNMFDDEGNRGSELRECVFQQAKATMRGAEAEISYNLNRDGLSARVFADTSRGSLDNAGSLPLQPATRAGVDLGYGTNDVTWFMVAKNLLNQDVRLSTSVLKDVAPLPGRNLIVGVRTRF